MKSTRINCKTTGYVHFTIVYCQGYVWVEKVLFTHMEELAEIIEKFRAGHFDDLFLGDVGRVYSDIEEATMDGFSLVMLPEGTNEELSVYFDDSTSFLIRVAEEDSE